MLCQVSVSFTVFSAHVDNWISAEFVRYGGRPLPPEVLRSGLDGVYAVDCVGDCVWYFWGWYSRPLDFVDACSGHLEYHLEYFSECFLNELRRALRSW